MVIVSNQHRATQVITWYFAFCDQFASGRGKTLREGLESAIRSAEVVAQSHLYYLRQGAFEARVYEGAEHLRRPDLEKDRDRIVESTGFGD